MANIVITPISRDNILSASKLADQIFDDEDIFPSDGLRASFDMDVFESLNYKRGGRFNWFKYWGAEDQDTRNIIGTVGIYEEKVDAENASWLGWYCVDPAYRGQHIGKKLLEFAIDQARKIGKEYMRVYTSNRPRSIIARNLYQKVGFKKIMNPKLNLGEDTVYLELKL